ncbi:transglutaminase domain-containing protein [Halorussus ruber]|uniref:transglutaminase domain-containing protein n=1 Tax=Halorussus ruber TaxID=1126238 RepID=UPI0010931408|nr:transglutaminase domain-containing protein [Halorussus ruber]
MTGNGNESDGTGIDAGRRRFLKYAGTGAITGAAAVGEASASEREKTLPPGADGDNSIAIDNGSYRIELGETETGTRDWFVGENRTLYHEFFALQDGSGSVTPSYNPDAVVDYFPETGDPGTTYSATMEYSVGATTLEVVRTVSLDPEETTFTVTYEATNVGSSSVGDLRLYQYCDYDVARSLTDQARYHADADMPYVRDTGDGLGLYTGFAGEKSPDGHHLSAYYNPLTRPIFGYDAVLDSSLNNESVYPDSGGDDVVVAARWSLGSLAPDETTSFSVQFGAADSRKALADLIGNTGTTQGVELGDPTVDQPQLRPLDDLPLEFPLSISGISDDVTLEFQNPDDYASLLHDSKTVSPDAETVINRLDIAGPDHDRIRADIIDPEGAGRLPTDGPLTVTVTAYDSSSTELDTFDLSVNNLGGPNHVEYPDFSRQTGIPTGGRDRFYLDGDDYYHNDQSLLVREWALRAAANGEDTSRASDLPLPRDPREAANRVWRFVKISLSPDGEPDEFTRDINLARWIDKKLLGPDRSYLPLSVYSRQNGHICIEHTYLLSSFARTVGLPTREMTVGLAAPGGGYGYDSYTTWYQESAAQVFYEGEWHFYDSYIFGEGARDPDRYLDGYTGYKLWETNYRAEETTMPDGTTRWGHDFGIDYEGDPRTPSQWEFNRSVRQSGLLVTNYSPVRTDVTDERGRGVDATLTEGPGTEVTETDPDSDIPGSVRVPKGATGFTDAADPDSTYDLREGLFVPDDADSELLSLDYEGTDDGEYTTVLAQVRSGDDGELRVESETELTLEVAEGETQNLEVERSSGGGDDGSDSGGSGGFEIRKIPASIDVDPDAINPAAKGGTKSEGGGKWLTAYVELGDNSLGVEVADIALDTVTMNGVPAVTDRKYGFVKNPPIEDRDGDGFPELAVKFPREAVAETLDAGGEASAELVVSGEVGDVTFEGSDSVRVVGGRRGKGGDRGGNGGGKSGGQRDRNE